MNALPALPGTYILILALAEPSEVPIGRLGVWPLPAGAYAYVGSACGPGGLAGRLRHHLTPVVRPHWHIDYLRRRASVSQVWYSVACPPREHDWAALLAQLPGAELPIPGFGASDCRCLAHLLHLAGPPSFETVQDLLRRRFPADPPVEGLGAPALPGALF